MVPLLTDRIERTRTLHLSLCLSRWLWHLQVSVPKAHVLLVVTHVECVEASVLDRLQQAIKAEAKQLLSVCASRQLAMEQAVRW